MLGKLGLPGIFGLLVVLGGIGLVAYVNLLIAAGLALVLSGLGFIVYGIVTQLVRSMGMGGMPVEGGME